MHPLPKTCSSLHSSSQKAASLCPGCSSQKSESSLTPLTLPLQPVPIRTSQFYLSKPSRESPLSSVPFPILWVTYSVPHSSVLCPPPFFVQEPGIFQIPSQTMSFPCLKSLACLTPARKLTAPLIRPFRGWPACSSSPAPLYSRQADQLPVSKNHSHALPHEPLHTLLLLPKAALDLAVRSLN